MLYWCVSIGKALTDLGASINLMPLSICRRLGELEIMPTRMTLQLADRSITRPYGVIEDVLVKVKQFTFPANFVVMDIEEDPEIPLILGRPFMLTTCCIVNMGKGKLELSVLFGVKVLLLVQLTLLNTDAEVSAMVSKRVQSRNRVRLCLDLVIMILLCREIFFTESKK